MRRLLLAFVLGLCVGPVAAAPPPDRVLERVVAVVRHGIRAPTLTAAVARFASEPWPALPVNPGDLTPHGAAALRTLGADLRSAYFVSGRLPLLGCATSADVFIRADNATSRTRDSAAALAGGLGPGCTIDVQTVAGPEPDPLFAGLDAKICPFDPAAARAAMLAAIGGDLAHPTPDYPAELRALEAVIAPDAKGTETPVLAGDNSLTLTNAQIRLAGPLADGAALAEALELSYAEGVPGAGWGRLDPAGLAVIMRLHTTFATLLRRPPYVAAHAGAALAHAVLTTLGLPAGAPGAPMPGPAAKLVAFVGHDVTLASLAAILGVDWTLPGQPDETAPDTALVFELWRDGLGARSVKLAVRYQTLDALQSAGLSRIVPLAVPGCGDADSGCSLPAFGKMMIDRLPADCP